MNCGSFRTLSTFGKVPCAQCGATLIAPIWSEFVDEQRVRHLWSCDDCSYEFETLVFFGTGDDAPTIVPPLMAA